MSSSKNKMCVRCKRRDQTFFITCSRADTFMQIKEQVSVALSGETPASDIRLFTNMTEDRELTDDATIADHDIDNDAILYMVFRRGDDDDWEDIEVAELASND